VTARSFGPVAAIAVIVAALGACKRAPRSERSAGPSLPSASPAGGDAPTTLAATALAPAPSVAARAGTAPLTVPRAAHPVVLSSEFDVNVWGSAVNTHTLLDAAGQGAVPVSEARFLWGNGQLYFHFYAGDLDLEVREKKRDGAVYKDDAVTLAFFGPDQQTRMVSVSPTGVLADGVCPRDAQTLADARCDMRWDARSKVSFDYDGTLNKLGDFDEEWNVELAIPLKSLGVSALPGTHLSFALRRCEMAFDGQRACGIWGGVDAPAELILGS
jgi:hypothetical protein